MKVALMGQNGAGKSTLFKLLTKEIQPSSGEISVDKRLIVAIAHQVILPSDMTLTIEQYFQKWLGNAAHYELQRKLSGVLDVVNLKASLNKVIKSFSGGQQARLLLAGHFRLFRDGAWVAALGCTAHRRSHGRGRHSKVRNTSSHWGVDAGVCITDFQSQEI